MITAHIIIPFGNLKLIETAIAGMPGTIDLAKQPVNNSPGIWSVVIHADMPQDIFFLGMRYAQQLAAQ